jgi:PKD repeat protein
VTDNVGNSFTDTLPVYLDNSVPAISIEVSDPKTESVETIVEETTQFTVTADDGQGSGINTVKYNILKDAESTGWTTYTSPFSLPDYGDGKYVIKYATDDQLGNSWEQEITVVNAVPPIAEANGLYETEEGTELTLYSTGSYDPDGEIASYLWDLDGDGEYDDAVGANPTHTWMDDSTVTIGLKVVDDDGYWSVDTADVTVHNVAPDTDLDPETACDEGEAFSTTGAIVDPGADTWTATVDYGDGDGEQPLTLSGKDFTLSNTYYHDGLFAITIKVTDDDDGVGTETLLLAVRDRAPTAEFTWSPATQQEGLPVQFTDLSTSYPDNIVSWSWDFGFGGQSTDQSPVFTYTEDGVYTVTLTVIDIDGSIDTIIHEVHVLNTAPVVGEITTTLDPVAVGEAVLASVDFSDSGVQDTHTAVWDWGDSATSMGTVSESNGFGTATGSHVYDTPGVYTISCTIEDEDGSSGASRYQYVVVYDPEGGFVTGGGWIWSPEGAYAPDPTLTGKATFGFVSKYRKEIADPTGNTEFIFHAGDLEFHSSSYDWLVIAGSNAKYKGAGSINEEGEYKFMLTATDGDLKDAYDLFRIKIWMENEYGAETIIYDNQMDAPEDDFVAGTNLGGGNITIHKVK